MQGNKRKLSLRYRISELEKGIRYVLQSMDSVIKTTNVLGSTLEQYISMKGDTEEFVKHLEKVIEDENKSSKKGQKKSSTGSRAPKTGGKPSETV